MKQLHTKARLLYFMGTAFFIAAFFSRKPHFFALAASCVAIGVVMQSRRKP
jgi:hypothetical protein